MITAKDEFFLEREHIQQLFEIGEANGISQRVIYEIIEEVDGEFDSGEILKRMYERDTSALVRLQAGHVYHKRQINKAAKEAVNRPWT